MRKHLKHSPLYPAYSSMIKKMIMFFKNPYMDETLSVDSKNLRIDDFVQMRIHYKLYDEYYAIDFMSGYDIYRTSETYRVADFQQRVSYTEAHKILTTLYTKYVLR